MALLLRYLLWLALFCGLSASAASQEERVVESVLPSLASGPACSSTVELQNLGDRPVIAEVEAHKASGALAPLAGHPKMTVHLGPGERSEYKLQIDEETTGAWVKVRERIPSPQLSPVVAVSGATECLIANQLRTTTREVAYPVPNPWFSGDVEEMRGDLLALINTSELPVKASACYSSGGLFSVPSEPNPRPQLVPICSTAFQVQIPPFGTRQFPVERDGSSYLSLKTEGSAIILQMLRPLEASVKIYTVDSTVKFGSEVPKGPSSNP